MPFRVDPFATLPRAFRQPAILAVGLASVLLLGIVDHLSGPDLSFILFYLLPVFLAAWYGGLTGGLTTATAATAAWYAADWLAVPWTFHVAWNVLEKLVFFVLFAGLVARLKRSALAVYEREMSIARDVQRALFPARLPDQPGLDLAVRLVPNRVLSGDYYDVFPRAGRRLGLVIADVMGKGLPASLLTANLHALLHFAELSEPHAAAAERIETIHHHLQRHSPGRYATLVLAEIDLAGGSLEGVIAGHPSPLLWTADGGIQRLDSTGPPVGLVPASHWTPRRHAFPPGAVFVAYTDGVSEALDPAGREFGTDRLADVVERFAGSGASANEIAAGALAELRAWAAGAEWTDDVALLVARRLPAS